MRTWPAFDWHGRRRWNRPRPRPTPLPSSWPRRRHPAPSCSPNWVCPGISTKRSPPPGPTSIGWRRTSPPIGSRSPRRARSRRSVRRRHQTRPSMTASPATSPTPTSSGSSSTTNGHGWRTSAATTSCGSPRVGTASPMTGSSMSSTRPRRGRSARRPACPAARPSWHRWRWRWPWPRWSPGPGAGSTPSSSTRDSAPSTRSTSIWRWKGSAAWSPTGSSRLVVVVSHVPEMQETIGDLIRLDRDPLTGDTRVICADGASGRPVGYFSRSVEIRREVMMAPTSPIVARTATWTSIPQSISPSVSPRISSVPWYSGEKRATTCSHSG